jgi:hypothetical protein
MSAIACISAQQPVTPHRRDSANVPLNVFTREPISLRQLGGGPSGLFLDLVHVFSVVEIDRPRIPRQWRTTTLMYEYRLLDRDQRELLVYHWQPGSATRGPDYPHLHVSASLTARVDARSSQEIGLDKLHLPTDRVSFEAVVRMLIDEFGIAPRRNDWRDTLERTETIFRQHRRR